MLSCKKCGGINWPVNYFYRLTYIDRTLFVGLIKKTLRKFYCVALRNEIDVTGAWLNNLPVSCTAAWTYSKDRANFILARQSNF